MDFALVTSSDLGGLNDEVGDLRLDSRGDVVTVTGIDAIVQHIRVRFNTRRGEVFTDQRIGFPWFEEVLGVKQPDLDRIRSFVSRTIETVPGVREVNEVSLSLDNPTRTLTINFKATAVGGGVIDSSRYAPFILELGA